MIIFQVNVMVQEARNNASEELRTTADKYAACLKKSENDKEGLEKKLLEKDTEINWLTSALEELKTTAETQVIFINVIEYKHWCTKLSLFKMMNDFNVE